MALEVWSEMQFLQKIYTKDIDIDGQIAMSNVKKNGELIIGLKTYGVDRANIIEYSGPDCPVWVGLDKKGMFYTNGLNIYNQSIYAISRIYSPEDNLLNFDNTTTLTYAKTTPTRDYNGSKEQFCIQLDSTNGAVTLRNVPGGGYNEIYGGYITLYRPTTKGASVTNLHSLFLNTYNNGKTAIQKALSVLLREGWIKRRTTIIVDEKNVEAPFTKALDKITMQLNVYEAFTTTQEETTLISHNTTNPNDGEYRMPNDCLPTENKIYTEIPITYGSSSDTASTGRATINVYSSGVVTLSNIQVLQRDGMLTQWVNYNPSEDKPIKIRQIGDHNTKYEWSSPIQYNFNF